MRQGGRGGVTSLGLISKEGPAEEEEEEEEEEVGEEGTADVSGLAVCSEYIKNNSTTRVLEGSVKV